MSVVSLNVKPEAVVLVKGLPHNALVYATASSVAISPLGAMVMVALRPCYMRCVGGTVLRVEHVDSVLKEVSFAEVEPPSWWKDRANARRYAWYDAVAINCKCGHHRAFHVLAGIGSADDHVCNHDGCKCERYEEDKKDAVPKVRTGQPDSSVQAVPEEGRKPHGGPADGDKR